MSSSDRATLTVTAENPAVRITVIDGDLAPVEKGVGVGRLELDLVPGIYGVRFQAGASVYEETVVLRPGATENVHVDAMGFPTAAPLAKTRYTIDSHERAAHKLSQ